MLNPITKKQVDNFAAGAHHAVTISGPEGAGKGYLALHLALTLLGTEQEHTVPGGLRILTPANNTITVDMVRDLQNFLKLKTVGQGNIRRVVVIENAHTMTTEAQNAFLKALEEPPLDTVFVITTASRTRLLPTINSRTQHIALQSVALEQTTDYFVQQGYKKTTIEKNYLLSQGQTGLLAALLKEEDAHPVARAIESAKTVLGKNAFERLCFVETLAKQKEDLPVLMDGLYRIARAGLINAAQKQIRDDTLRWLRRLSSIDQAAGALQKNAQSKLVLTNLMLSL